MKAVTVEGSAFTGVNVSNPDDYFLIEDSKFINNRGTCPLRGISFVYGTRSVSATIAVVETNFTSHFGKFPCRFPIRQFDII